MRIPRIAALLAGAAATAVLAGMVVAPAQAAEPDRYGFALWEGVGQPTNATPAGTTVTSAGGTDRYQVKFPHQAARDGVVHVSAVTDAPVWCQAEWFGPVGVDEAVYVRCYRAGGVAVSSGFSVSFASSSNGPAVPRPGALGYVDTRPDGAIISQYNSAGRSNAVTAVAVGVYAVQLPGLGAPDPRVGGVQVTAVDRTRPVRCKVGRWVTTMNGQTVQVLCHNAAGAPVASRFTLTVQHLRSLLGGGQNPPEEFGYVWLQPPLGPPPTNVNSNLGPGGNRVLTSPTGVATVELPSLGKRPDNVQLTAFGAGAAFCVMTRPWELAGESTLVRGVRCVTTAGAPTTAAFLASYNSRL